TPRSAILGRRCDRKVPGAARSDRRARSHTSNRRVGVGGRTRSGHVVARRIVEKTGPPGPGWRDRRCQRESVVKVAEAIAETMVAEGIDTVFSLLGEATMHVVSALEGRGVKVVDCRHEGAAMAMADGYSRASGKPVVCAVTTGPAFAQPPVPLTSASRTRSQVVVFTGLRNIDNLGDRQRMDHQGIARMAGVEYRPLLDPGNVVERTREVMDLVRSSGKPVVFDVAEEVQTEDWPWEVEPRPAPAWLETQRIQPDPEFLARAVAMLESAAKPVILAGVGAVHSGAREELIALAAETGALLATSLDAKTLFDGDPFNAGIAGLYSSDPVMEL